MGVLFRSGQPDNNFPEKRRPGRVVALDATPAGRQMLGHLRPLVMGAIA
jgi:hypothetical protein